VSNTASGVEQARSDQPNARTRLSDIFKFDERPLMPTPDDWETFEIEPGRFISIPPKVRWERRSQESGTASSPSAGVLVQSEKEGAKQC